MLGGGETGSGDHIAEDGPAEIVPGSKREASPSNPVLQNAVQRFRGEILVQPSLISAVGNEAEKRPGRLASDRLPILEIAGGIAHHLGINQVLLVAFPDNVCSEQYRQQITCACGTGAGKTFRLKYIFLAGKIVRTARKVVVKLPKEYPYQEVYEYSLA